MLSACLLQLLPLLLPCVPLRLMGLWCCIICAVFYMLYCVVCCVVRSISSINNFNVQLKIVERAGNEMLHGTNSAYIPVWIYIYMYFEVYTSMCMYFFYAHRQPFFSRPRLFSRDLGCGARKGSACVPHASLGPGRAPWRALWAFKVARSGE